MVKPTILCSGFFPDRHNSIFEQLNYHFDVNLIFDVNWPGNVKRMPLIKVSDSEYNVKKYNSINHNYINELDNKLNIEIDQNAKEKYLNYFNYLSNHFFVIKDSLINFHKKKNVNAIIIVNMQLYEGISLIESAEELGIPTFYLDDAFSISLLSMNHNYLKKEYYSTLPKTTNIFTDSNLTKKIYEDLFTINDIDIPEIHITGSPSDLNKVKNVKVIPKKRLDEVNVLFCPSWPYMEHMTFAFFVEYYSYESFHLFCKLINKLKKKYPNKKFNSIVKLHPSLVNTHDINTSDIYINISQKYNLNISVETDSIRVFLDNSDLVFCSKNSGVALDAFITEVPCITYFSNLYKTMFLEEYQDVSNETLDNLTNLSKWNVQKFITNLDDAYKTSISFLEQKWSGEFSKLVQNKKKNIPDISIKEACLNISNIINDSINENMIVVDKSFKLNLLLVIPEFFGSFSEKVKLFIRNLSEFGYTLTIFSFSENVDNGFISLGLFESNKVYGFKPFNEPSNYINSFYDSIFANFLKNNFFNLIFFFDFSGFSATWLRIANELFIPYINIIRNNFFFCAKKDLLLTSDEKCSGPISLEKCRDCLINTVYKDFLPENNDESINYLKQRNLDLELVFTQSDFNYYFSEDIKHSHNNFGFNHEGESVIKNDNFEEIDKNIKKIVNIRKSFSKDQFIRMSDIFLNKTNYKEAEKILLLFYDGSSSKYLFNLGVCQYNLGKYEEAIDTFSDILDLGEINAEVCNYLAKSIEETGDYETANIFYEKEKSFLN